MNLLKNLEPHVFALNRGVTLLEELAGSMDSYSTMQKEEAFGVGAKMLEELRGIGSALGTGLDTLQRHKLALMTDLSSLEVQRMLHRVDELQKRFARVESALERAQRQYLNGMN